MANQQFTLEDLIPEEASFHLKKTDKTYVIRAVNIEDWTHLKRRHGEKLGEILQGKDWNEVCAIVYRLLSDADKEDFAAQDCTFYDEDTGEKTRGRIGGARLFAKTVDSIPEFIEVTKALYRAIGAGKPLDKMAKEKEAETDTKKKTVNPPQSS